MPDKRLIAILLLLICASAAYLFWGLKGPTGFILKLRGIKLGGLVTVGVAIGLSTVLFQTISRNRVLTPSIMGFDALYLFVQTSLVFLLGGIGFSHLPPHLMFAANTGALLVASVLLFTVILRRTRHDVQLMILVGVIFGLMFRSLSSFMQRMLDPSEFAILQSVMFAQFSGIDKFALLAAIIALGLVIIWLIFKTSVLDVMMLGRREATSLGLPYDRLQFEILCVISILVSVSTALVGPIVFLGLLVSALAHSLMNTHRHALLLPAAALISSLILVVGQAGFERILKLQSSLTVVIEFAGGLLFLILLTRGKIR